MNGNEQNEEVSLEYLRNVVLQFLEHKEMRVSALNHCEIKSSIMDVPVKSRARLIYYSPIHPSRDSSIDVQDITISIIS